MLVSDRRHQDLDSILLELRQCLRLHEHPPTHRVDVQRPTTVVVNSVFASSLSPSCLGAILLTYQRRTLKGAG
jgi:hypothetical protein